MHFSQNRSSLPLLLALIWISACRTRPPASDSGLDHQLDSQEDNLDAEIESSNDATLASEDSTAETLPDGPVDLPLETACQPIEIGSWLPYECQTEASSVVCRREIEALGLLRLRMYGGRMMLPRTEELACWPSSRCTPALFHPLGRRFGVETGSVTIEGSDGDGLYGRFSNLRLRRLRAFDGLSGELEPSGPCFEVQSAPFDMRSAGHPCSSHTECTGQTICDATTARCTNDTCLDDDGCAPGQRCLRVPGRPEGIRACVHTCEAVGSTCGADLWCIPGWDFNYCAMSGDAGLGQACTALRNDSTSGCEGGLSCTYIRGFESRCAQPCDRWRAPSPDLTPQCPGAERCLANDVCGPASARVDPASVGQTCTAFYFSDVPCGDDGERIAGFCNAQPSPDGATVHVCQAVCRDDSDCLTGVCRVTSGEPGVLVCQPE